MEERRYYLCLERHFIIIGGSYHKYNFCRKTLVTTSINLFVTTFVATKDVFYSFVATKVCFSRQTYVCHDTFRRDKHVKHKFAATNIILSRQTYFCRDAAKDVFVATNSVATKPLSRQK